MQGNEGIVICEKCGKEMSREYVIAAYYNNFSSHFKTEHAKIAWNVAFENVKLIDRKQQDYGPGNISQFGLVGVIIRMNDKIERLKNIFFERDGTPRKEVTVSNESIEDTLRDISNYGTIGYMVRTNQWPNK